MILFRQVPKETTMHYKTIVLELLKQKRELHNCLRSTRTLLSTMELYAGQLKTSHEDWMARLSQAKPGSDPSQIASEALEISLLELRDFLDSISPPDESEALSLEELLAVVRRRTRPE